MTRTPPQHGERRCYLRGCRRPECLDAHYRYMSRYRLDRERGQKRRVPAGPTLDRIRGLLEAGWLRSQIADATGCSARGISGIASGKVTEVSPATERRVLGLPVGPPPPPRYTDATGTVRRLRALVVMGHSMASIAVRIGFHPNALSHLAHGAYPRVCVTTAESVARVYRQWVLVPGSSVRSRNHAARQGWHGPLAWDTDTIDDPAALPEPGPAAREGGRAEAAAAASAEIHHLAAFGVSSGEIARRVGRSESYVRGQLAGDRGPGWRKYGEAA
ncbi:hypothetical protein [Streptomyces sp. SAJ15]|uniref:hypothetical protein n=1 Tax=Streptomyces sp. SAJ15 TaxID=2011095 RepID=UPI00118582BE|nr:hypothetical protein [Streptomyces sp. SAJ15]TVL89817.1 hypothetical protein CD790_25830 [Streptomyces sp. SAJ15]